MNKNKNYNKKKKKNIKLMTTILFNNSNNPIYQTYNLLKFYSNYLKINKTKK